MLFATPWTKIHQVPLSMEFSRQEYWSDLPSPPPGDLPNPETESRSPELQAIIPRMHVMLSIQWERDTDSGCDVSCLVYKLPDILDVVS